MIYMSSAFSLNMLSTLPFRVEITEIAISDVHDILDSEDVTFRIGHESTAQVLSEALGLSVAADRRPVEIKDGDFLVVAQVTVRPAEGQIYTSKELESIPLKFFWITCEQV